MTITPLDVIVAEFRQAHPTLTVRAMSGNGQVVNVGPADRMTPADTEALRAALTEGGWREIDSWIATEGLTLLSSGIQSVSLRVTPANP